MCGSSSWMPTCFLLLSLSSCLSGRTKSYEYVIVGAGSSGATLAGKPAKAGKSVLLLEAGPDDDWKGKDAGGTQVDPLVPIDTLLLQYVPDIDDAVMSQPVWPYERTVDPLLLKMTDMSKPLSYLSEFMPRARIVGGCSMHNWMIYLRPSPESQNSWGVDEWNWQTLFPKYKAMETDLERDVDMEYHGDRGENYVSTPPLYDADRAWLTAASKVAGVPFNTDFNGATRLGVGTFPKSMYQGRRWSAGKAFLTPEVRRLPNFHLHTMSAATKVLFEGTKATGVNYVDVDRKYKRAYNDSEVHTAFATKEVILAAGTFRSAQLLLLSGIGPTALFELYPEVPKVAISEGVGQNLQDHLVVENAASVNPPFITPTEAKDDTYDFGPMGGHFKSSWCKARNCSSHDMQYICGSGPSDRSFSCYVGLFGHLQSEPGFLRLKSLDPLEYPAIFTNYLGAKEDVERLAEGVQMAHRIFSSDPKTFGRAPQPNKDHVYAGHGMTDLDYQEAHKVHEYVQRHATTIYHPVGTCKMGLASDEYAVVDADLKVHGVQGLRVADASIMPRITDSNTDQPTRMIGYHLADIILAESPREVPSGEVTLVPVLDVNNTVSMIPGRQKDQRVWRRLSHHHHHLRHSFI